MGSENGNFCSFAVLFYADIGWLVSLKKPSQSCFKFVHSVRSGLTCIEATPVDCVQDTQPTITYGPCSSSCGSEAVRIQSKTYRIITLPRNEGKACTPASTSTVSCNLKTCPGLNQLINCLHYCCSSGLCASQPAYL